MQHSSTQIGFKGYETRCLNIVKSLSEGKTGKSLDSQEIFSVLQDYTKKIPHPTSFQMIRGKILGSGKSKYLYLNDFALDVRRIFGNYNRYNYWASQSKDRREINKILLKFEQAWYELVLEINYQYPGMYYLKQPLTELRACLAAYEDVVQLSSHADVAEGVIMKAIDAFMDPIQLLFSGDDLKSYFKIVKKPISFGEIISKLFECEYSSLDELFDEVDLIVGNCSDYWSHQSYQSEQGAVYIKDSLLIKSTFVKSIHTILNNPKSPANIPMPKVQSNINSRSSVPIPKKVIEDNKEVKSVSSKNKKGNGNNNPISSLKADDAAIIPAASDVASSSAAQITSDGNAQSSQTILKKSQKLSKMIMKNCIDRTKEHCIIAPSGIRISTAGPFLKAVDPLKFPDYATIVLNPMDLTRIEKKLNSDKYIESGLAGIMSDMILIRDNAHIYNTGIEGLEVRIMADTLLSYFQFLVRSSIQAIKSSSSSEKIGLLKHLLSDELSAMLDSVNILEEEREAHKYLSASGKSIAEIINQSSILSAIGKNVTAVTQELKVEPASKSLTKQTISIPKKKQASSTAINTTAISQSLSGGNDPLPIVSDDIFDDEMLLFDNSSKTVGKSDGKKRKRNPNDDNGASGNSRASASKNKKSSSSISLTQLNASDDNDNYDYYDAESVADTYAAPNTKHPRRAVSQQSDSNSQSHDDRCVNNADVNINVTNDDSVVPMREWQAWEVAADSILKLICKHPYVDMTKPTVVTNFMLPVVQAYPTIAAEYLSIIKNPMDLYTLRGKLDYLELSGPQEFMELLVSVFQNAVDYYGSLPDNGIIAPILIRCKHLLQYSHWLVLEGNCAPLSDDNNHSSNDQFCINGFTNRTMLMSERSKREQIMQSITIESMAPAPFTECKKLLKDLERCRNNHERIQLNYFIVPVNEKILPDYSVYIRHPVDLSTIKYRLDGTLPTNVSIADMILKSLPRYDTYFSFVSDLRRVFSNAIKYNEVHLETDPTGVSKLVFEAAKLLQSKLESLLVQFSLVLCDRIQRTLIVNRENDVREMERRKKREKELEDERLFEQKIRDEMKADDQIFADDYDVEKKKLETKQQLETHLLQQRVSLLRFNSQSGNVFLDDSVEEMSDDPSKGGGLSMTSSIFEKLQNELIQSTAQSNELLVYGFGCGGRVPNRFMTATVTTGRQEVVGAIQMKKRVLEHAREYWRKVGSTHNSRNNMVNSSNDVHNNRRKQSQSQPAAAVITTANNVTANAIGDMKVPLPTLHITNNNDHNSSSNKSSRNTLEFTVVSNDHNSYNDQSSDVDVALGMTVDNVKGGVVGEPLRITWKWNDVIHLTTPSWKKHRDSLLSNCQNKDSTGSNPSSVMKSAANPAMKLKITANNRIGLIVWYTPMKPNTPDITQVLDII
eukprot:gene13845-18568_t